MKVGALIKSVEFRAAREAELAPPKSNQGGTTDATDHDHDTRRRWHSGRGTDLTAYAAGRERRTGQCRSDGRASRTRPENAACRRVADPGSGPPGLARQTP